MTSQPQSQIFPEKISNPVFLARKTLGLSQEQLADLLALTKNYIWMLEAGRRPVSKALLNKVDKLVRSHTSRGPPQAFHEGEPLPGDRYSPFPAGPGIMRMADQFERYVINQFGEMQRELKSISARLEEIERARPYRNKENGGPK